MHYIRFLKTPRLVTPAGGPPSVQARITITNDLGDDFLASDLDILVVLEHASGNSVSDSSRPPRPAGGRYVWNVGYAHSGLSIEVRVPEAARNIEMKSLKMYIGAAQDSDVPDMIPVRNWQDILAQDKGGVVGARAVVGEIGLCERIFTQEGGPELHIWEETGNSIARHIWDAGLVLSAYLTAIYAKGPIAPPAAAAMPPLPSLAAATLHQPNLHVLELGAGCGIVGITLSRLGLPNVSKIMLTDLPDATDILTTNLSPRAFAAQSAFPTPTRCVLDWTAPLPRDITATAWDLILVADCTYNPDFIPDLVATFGRLAATRNDGQVTTVLLAMKDRHRSEGVFFTEMAGAGWEEKERAVVRVSVLGGDGEEIRIFVYQRAENVGCVEAALS
ncbi:hypothetical protein LZ554_005325 [Drepanopeziza brunnea f. sp. 'monogermtubi']|nr:hypothetical protein LZ554_005325 [Drepanopeziza brunnea f. sp. 'monogermtubi']